uniref:PILD PROCESSED PROTEIN n=1 Tax=Shewanella oneidensis (strain ATCC 700550 / JCM 31522 / CIP 106686 / LMG 19005 / NCIMB 14063 / MR-1) TaxID=211586 RepID=UPI000620A903|nr:Chain A, PILD PROCESSED PROTEIN [Shewanella oneidensis MR-1]4D40_B Chain B, PILD PROCESSED PROTEIN [Shewanella oneidensis MR-1]4US7_A Chain A, Pild Processed Protein [Shewanella oneidensis MR-1]4US7_B Chain B, Pild Processed Protein [Shewanella oneidensis MR-1]
GKQGRRFDAQQYLVTSAQALERHYSRNGLYPASQSLANSPYYSFSYTPTADKFGFSLKAVPTNRQSDPCGTLSLDHKGVRVPATNCWSH